LEDITRSIQGQMYIVVVFGIEGTGKLSRGVELTICKQAAPEDPY